MGQRRTVHSKPGCTASSTMLVYLTLDARRSTPNARRNSAPYTRMLVPTLLPTTRVIALAHNRFYRVLRHMMALVVVVCLGGSWVEAALPSVHDVDASVARATAVESISGTADSPVHHADESQVPGAPSHSGAQHTFHVDHCGHTHLVSRAPQTVRATPAEVCEQGAWPPVEKLASTDLPRHLRPPIA